MNHHPHAPRSALALSALAASLLAACGGGGSDAASTPAATTTTTTAAPDTGATAAAAPVLTVQPTFHMAPVVLDEPSDIDADGHGRSATMAARTTAVPAAQVALGTSRLTPQGLREQLGRVQALAAGSQPLATKPMVATTYTPAQIRAAYGLPALTASAAELGAGQTIYIIDANDDPKIADELAAFNNRFGLPACTAVSITAATARPLAAPGNACTFSKIYANASGGQNTAAPAYDAGWASEIALDVQWAHAIAPLARIVLVEATSAGNDALLGAVRLANSLGPGIVSMSFGGGESPYTTTWDSAFTGTGMTYVASTGDSGYQINWPAVSSKVLAVGGTTLNYTGGTRSEAAWSGSGGGVSAYVALPSYQAGVTVPGQKATKMRGVADVSFNADPYSGQYTAIMTPSASTVSWASYGGTSIAAPQWAGLLAVANAKRGTAKGVLGAVNPILYTTIAANATSYSQAFADVTSGSNGNCSNCGAIAKYDIPTGLGTPNAGALLALLSGASVTVPAPTLPASALPTGFTGKAWTASFDATDTSGSPLTYAITGQPSGLTISGNTMSWAAPVAGTYNFTVTVINAAGGKATGPLSLVISKPVAAPVVTSATVTGATGTALSIPVKATSPGGLALKYSIASGAPVGMTISDGGVLGWASPTVGTWAIAVRATDSAGTVGQGTITLTVAAANRAPLVSSGTITAPVAVNLSVAVPVTDPDGDKFTLALTGAPAGMTISATGVLSWAKTVKGTYTVVITAVDARGATGKGTVTMTVK